MGEIVAADALVDGLRHLGIDVTVARSLRAFARHAALRRVTGPPAVYFFDPVTLAMVTRYALLPSRDAPRVRVLEWYGTPRSRVSRLPPGLEPSQYLLPYPWPDGENTFLGYALTDAAGAAIADADALTSYVAAALSPKQNPDGVVWGKDARYLDGDAGVAVHALAAIAPLHLTIAPERGGNTLSLPANATNHGALAGPAWRALLRRAAFVAGLGDPVSGPTALDALVEGCAYLDPVYRPLRAVNGIAELTIRSQHPFAATIGPPFVLSVNLRDPASCARAGAAAADPSARRAALPRLVHALAPFTFQAYVERLRSTLSG
jgi:hypothetical protein